MGRANGATPRGILTAATIEYVIKPSRGLRDYDWRTPRAGLRFHAWLSPHAADPNNPSEGSRMELHQEHRRINDLSSFTKSVIDACCSEIVELEFGNAERNDQRKFAQPRGSK